MPPLLHLEALRPAAAGGRGGAAAGAAGRRIRCQRRWITKYRYYEDQIQVQVRSSVPRSVTPSFTGVAGAMAQQPGLRLSSGERSVDKLDIARYNEEISVSSAMQQLQAGVVPRDKLNPENPKTLNDYIARGMSKYSGRDMPMEGWRSLPDQMAAQEGRTVDGHSAEAPHGYDASGRPRTSEEAVLERAKARQAEARRQFDNFTKNPKDYTPPQEMVNLVKEGATIPAQEPIPWGPDSKDEEFNRWRKLKGFYGATDPPRVEDARGRSERERQANHSEAMRQWEKSERIGVSATENQHRANAQPGAVEMEPWTKHDEAAFQTGRQQFQEHLLSKPGWNKQNFAANYAAATGRHGAVGLWSTQELRPPEWQL
eukprot:TRINITY_DN2350_c1_g3_i2.p1 TRINITY_DN2350_c1_g3~~TRINITY_DN2350_c1_g3_i2.p1  ORF type:complete len:400 (+),score=95.11 TRINITY_DN2350_c1_g3_i2:88-1200(+)